MWLLKLLDFHCTLVCALLCSFKIDKQRKMGSSSIIVACFNIHDKAMLLSTAHVRKRLLKPVPLHFQNGVTACVFACL